jgi:Ulp1 family protease
MSSSSSSRANERRTLLGHDFSHSEMQGVEDQMEDAAPLLDDMSMLFLTSAARLSKSMTQMERDRIDVLNPIFQTMLLTENSSYRGIVLQPNALYDSSYHRATQYFRDALSHRTNHCKFIPLHCNSHWSLLYYDGETHRWHHYDSVAGYHEYYAITFMAFLAHENIISSQEALNAVLAIENVPNAPYTTWRPASQKGGWECGFYTLMFAFAIVNTTNMHPLGRTAQSSCDHAYLKKFRRFCREWVGHIISHINDD